ncbi:hypothetical protein H261_23020 [Paramagnetospirillum caucaseum]|uniref:Uncharacterized protein n=1 Tax=Paramagnetospirillum caucaseum TaxID=1244869 RepID=M2ZJP8_9PROT|nr:hypothetical protein [Paramagnetospirillum caucaseum]EME67537.1 hypothetical protein H261_23020 [Paramagnetospirillum caucaseum]
MPFYESITAHPFTAAIAIIVAFWMIRLLADFALHVVLAVAAAGAVIVGVNAINLPDDLGPRLMGSFHAELHNVAEMVASAWSLLLH